MNDPVETVLQDAGRRWREAQAPPPGVDRSRWPAPVRPGRPSRWAPVAAVGLATAVVAGTTSAVLLGGRGDDPRPASRTDHVQVAARVPSSPSPAPAELVIHDGDLAEATGEVRAVPGRPVRLCAPVITTTGRAWTPDDPPCRGVEVRGVDLERVGRPRKDGVTVGRATLRGVWRGGVLHVTGPAARPTPSPFPPRPLPCSPPPGGWLPHDGDAPGGVDDDSAFVNYIRNVRPERFGSPYGAEAGAGPDAPRVVVAAVVGGDVQAAAREVRQRFANNVCLVDDPGAMSIAGELRLRDAAQAALQPVMDDRGAGISSVAFADTIDVELLMLTPDLYVRLLAAVPEHLRVRPWLSPVRS